VLIGVSTGVVFPSPSHTEPLSGSAVAFIPAAPKPGGLRQVNRKTPPVMHMSSPIKRSRSWETYSSSAVDPSALIPAIPKLGGLRQIDRKTPPVMQMSSPMERLETYNSAAVDSSGASQSAEAITTGAVPNSISNRMQPGEPVVGVDLGVNGLG
jgi:hypothetical protein